MEGRALAPRLGGGFPSDCVLFGYLNGIQGNEAFLASPITLKSAGYH